MKSEQEELADLMANTADEAVKSTGGDSTPNKRVGDIDIPDEELTEIVMADLKNDMADKEDHGFTEKREYDLKAYYGIADEFLRSYPYDNASAYPVPITTVQVDTGHSMVSDLKWRNSQKVVTVSPVSDEDRKKSKNLEWLLNWQCINDIQDMQKVDSYSDFLMLLHGTSYEKVLRTSQEPYKIGVTSVPIERMYMPIDQTCMDVGYSDHCIQMIPLSSNDVRQRISSGVYRNLDKIGKGFIPGSTTIEMMDLYRKEIHALDVTMKQTRDTWWIGEYYKTYYPRGSLRRVEIVVWFSPTTGAILRKIRNEDNMRPFVDKYVYENGLAFRESLPNKIRNVQEKATYTDKQATDAVDKAISPAGFYDGTEKFDPRVNVRAPTSLYPMKNVNSIQWEPINIAPIMEQRREVKNLWLEAERITGFTDLQQGISTSASANTLGQDQMRSQRADVRFSKIAKLINDHWKRKVNKIYQYNDKYMPRSTKVKVLGVNRYESIDKLFPRETEGENGEYGIGLTGKYDFSIANKSMEAQERENQRRSTFYGTVLAHPIFGQDVGNAYRALEQQAEANEIYDLEAIVKRPPQAVQLTPDEVIERLMDGDEVQPDIGWNPSEYITSLEMYTRTGNFKEADQQVQLSFFKLLAILEAMRQAAVLTLQDYNMTEAVKGSLPDGMNPPPIPTQPQNGGGQPK